jgi:hypothetical protein
MAAQTLYSLNVSDASGTGVGPFNVTVLLKPTTAAATPATPSVTTGPLGSSGTVAAGSFANIGDALQKAVVVVLDDHAIEVNG